MSRSRGFTLIEVLIALSLTGLLVMVLFSGFQVGIRSWQSVERHTARVEEGRQLSSLLSRQLAQVQPFILGGEQRSESAFLGEAKRLRYVAPLSISSGNLPYLFELVSEWQGQPGVWARFAPFREGQDAETILADAPFLQISQGLRLTFGFFNRETTEQWVPEYEYAELPQLVSVQMVGDDQAWPLLILPVTQVGPQ
ncbi:MAG: prepilin-type N-terminal cleavage/methylation domain-containing protein [Pseudomonas sp.]|uniref:prepilin-type N-terminal cleavage/methylation domain-containing protein n=1 Tax=Pseudomonas sp. TaxID=306 RepID=UPI00339A2BC4